MAFVASSKGVNLEVSTANPQVTFNVPAGTNDGDMMFVGVYTSSGPGTFSTPAGWNNGGSFAMQTSRFRYFYRVADSEPASYTFTWTISAGAHRQIMAMCATYDGYDASDLFTTDFVIEDSIILVLQDGNHEDVDFPAFTLGAGLEHQIDMGRAPTFLIGRGTTHIDFSGTWAGDWTPDGAYTTREFELEQHTIVDAPEHGTAMYLIDEAYVADPPARSHDYDFVNDWGDGPQTSVTAVRIGIEHQIPIVTAFDHWAWTEGRNEKDSWQA